MNNTKALLLFKKIKKMTENFSIPLEKEFENLNPNNFQLLISIILSARTKDTITVKVLPELFKSIKTPQDLNKLNVKQIEKLIYPVGFYKTKANNLKKLSSILIRLKDIPYNLDDLLKLPGVGRKTANLYLSKTTNSPHICVDIHVHRISNRVFFKEETKNPFETEMKLQSIFPKNLWNTINTVFVRFGQNICLSRNPICDICLIKNECIYYRNNK